MDTLDYATTGVIVVDHGSRRKESNEMLNEVVQVFQQINTHWQIVEPAHMEISEPSIKTAFDRCVEQGAKFVIVSPFFLLPGRHWAKDIPNLVQQAASAHSDSNIQFLVTAPLGAHTLMAQLMQARIEHCVEAACGAGDVGACEICVREQRQKCRALPDIEEAHS